MARNSVTGNQILAGPEHHQYIGCATVRDAYVSVLVRSATPSQPELSMADAFWVWLWVRRA
jgi:hypothetical protein